MAQKTITFEKITSKLKEFNKKYNTPTDIMTIAFLNEEAQPLPKGYFLYLTRNGKMIFGPYQNSSFLVCVQNWDFVGELYNWFATRISTVNPEI